MADSLQKHMIYESRRKSRAVAYLLWFFVGIFGVHRFYTGHTKSGIAQLVLLLTGVGLLILLPWLLIDLFLIPGLVRERNIDTMQMLGFRPEGAQSPRPSQLAPQENPEPMPPEPKLDPIPLDPRREAMIEDLRKTGYRKKRRDPLYR